MSSQKPWAKLAPLSPDKELVNLYTESNEASVEDKWRIERRSTGGTWIINLSSLSIKIGENWLDKNQEKQLFGGEMLAFCQNKKKKNINFDYVFCIMDSPSMNELKTNRENGSSESSNQASQKLIKMDNVVQEEAQCSICMDTLYRCATVNPCGHNFCGHCLIGHLRNSPLCPLCNSKIKSVIKHSAFKNIIEAAAKNSSNKQRSFSVGIIPLQKDLEGDVHIIGKEIFIGSMFNNKKEGQGALITPSGQIFQCVWKNDLKEGEGAWILKSGKTINGLWLHGWLQPNIEIKFVNGNLYKGEAKELRGHGKGILKYHNGEVYEGDFKEGFFEGLGKHFYKNRNEYEGEWKQGKIHGFGVMKYSDGDVYEGEWREGIRAGNGVIIRNNGNKYEGAWANDKFNGIGKYTWENGAEFEGDWIDSWRNGNGTMKYVSGEIYKGEWQNDKRHGKGVMTLKNGRTAEGNWIDGDLQPLVKIEYPNGSRYEGKVKSDTFQKDGKGVIIFNNGSRYAGQWKNDKETSQGKYTLESVDRAYEEFWEEGNVLNSILTLTNGTKYKATWEEVKEVEEKKVKGRKKKQNCK